LGDCGQIDESGSFHIVRTNYTGAKLEELYMTRIVCLHGVPKNIVSDRGSQFTSRFWKKLHECLDTQLNFSSAYHPQTDGQTERANQVLEDLSVQDDLTYTEYPIKILDTLTRITRNKVIKMCKVQWSYHGEDEATWKREEELRIDFPHLFSSPS
jgi:transposase InsO family protein